MLFIFRKIRRSFFLPGKVRTYMAYAIGEIVLIVVGILIAVEIGDRNQASKDRAEETQILIRLKSEFEENQGKIERSLERYERIIRELKSFLEIIGPEPAEVPDRQIHRYISTYDWTPEYVPNSVVMNSLTSSGKISQVSSLGLNDKLISWPTMMAEIRSRHQNLEDSVMQYGIHWADVHSWKDSIRETGGMKDIGKSHFPFDQKTFLSMPILESAVAIGLITSNDFLRKLKEMKTLQQSILDLIDAELAERGMSGS